MNLEEVLKDLVPVTIMSIYSNERAQSAKFVYRDGMVEYNDELLRPNEVVERYVRETPLLTVVGWDVAVRHIEPHNNKSYRWEILQSHRDVMGASETFAPGDKVHYAPNGCAVRDVINGIVKSRNELDGQTVFVVFKCNEDWDNYADYTGQSTRTSDLRPGWFDHDSLEKYPGSVPFMGSPVVPELAGDKIKFTFPPGAPPGFADRASKYFDGSIECDERHLVVISFDRKMCAYTMLFSLINHYDHI
jgi:hypothetical protein